MCAIKQTRRLFTLRHRQVRARNPFAMYAASEVQHNMFTGNDEAVKALIDCGSDVNAVDSHKKTPLHFAVGRGYATIAAMLIEKGAKVNKKDEAGIFFQVF